MTKRTAKNDNKTQPTSVSPRAFVMAVAHPRRREDGLALLEFFDRVTEMPARMWGATIVGYGRYHYRTGSGLEGDFMITGFSPRKSALTVYIMPGYRDMSDKLVRLGKHKSGKSCLYINKLSDIELDVLEEIVRDGMAYMRENYETWDM